MDQLFVRFANVTARFAGKPWTFLICVLIVVGWALSGPVFGFNDTWQLVINTGTTIITFLMVFLIQNTQNRDGAAMQAKLDELLHAVRKADERFIGIEHLGDKDLDLILQQVETRAYRLHDDDAFPVVATRKQDKAKQARQARSARASTTTKTARTTRRGKGPAKA
jgi:low affinity Fe/Cu permease